MHPRHPATIALAVAVAALLASCGDDDTAAPALPASAVERAVVTIERSRFEPDPIEVRAGDEVIFENLDPFAHTITAADASSLRFDSGELGQDETFVQVFEEAGTYAYFCEVHPTMRAEVLVT